MSYRQPHDPTHRDYNDPRLRQSEGQNDYHEYHGSRGSQAPQPPRQRQRNLGYGDPRHQYAHNESSYGASRSPSQHQARGYGDPAPRYANDEYSYGAPPPPPRQQPRGYGDPHHRYIHDRHGYGAPQPPLSSFSTQDSRYDGGEQPSHTEHGYDSRHPPPGQRRFQETRHSRPPQHFDDLSYGQPPLQTDYDRLYSLEQNFQNTEHYAPKEAAPDPDQPDTGPGPMRKSKNRKGRRRNNPYAKPDASAQNTKAQAGTQPSQSVNTTDEAKEELARQQNEIKREAYKAWIRRVAFTPKEREPTRPGLPAPTIQTPAPTEETAPPVLDAGPSKWANKKVGPRVNVQGSSASQSLHDSLGSDRLTVQPQDRKQPQPTSSTNCRTKQEQGLGINPFHLAFSQREQSMAEARQNSTARQEADFAKAKLQAAEQEIQSLKSRALQAEQSVLEANRIALEAQQSALEANRIVRERDTQVTSMRNIAHGAVNEAQKIKDFIKAASTMSQAMTEGRIAPQVNGKNIRDTAQGFGVEETDMLWGVVLPMAKNEHDMATGSVASGANGSAVDREMYEAAEIFMNEIAQSNTAMEEIERTDLAASNVDSQNIDIPLGRAEDETDQRVRQGQNELLAYFAEKEVKLARQLVRNEAGWRIDGQALAKILGASLKEWVAGDYEEPKALSNWIYALPKNLMLIFRLRLGQLRQIFTLARNNAMKVTKLEALEGVKVWFKQRVKEMFVNLDGALQGLVFRFKQYYLMLAPLANFLGMTPDDFYTLFSVAHLAFAEWVMQSDLQLGELLTREEVQNAFLHPRPVPTETPMTPDFLAPLNSLENQPFDEPLQQTVAEEMARKHEQGTAAREAFKRFWETEQSLQVQRRIAATAQNPVLPAPTESSIVLVNDQQPLVQSQVTSSEQSGAASVGQTQGNFVLQMPPPPPTFSQVVAIRQRRPALEAAGAPAEAPGFVSELANDEGEPRVGSDADSNMELS